MDGQFAGLVGYEATDDRYVIREVLDDVRARQVTATNRCPIMDHFVEKNPEYGR